ncbi:MAG TPA: hypothetical protein VNG12_15295, partial [Acidimicrobiales bacterium]|nr:hypothetical protein [Acidimicrobiales bacterium]
MPSNPPRKGIVTEADPPTFQLGCHSEYGRLNAVVVGSVDGLAYPPWNRNIRYLSGEVADLLAAGPPGDAVDVRRAAPHLHAALAVDVERVAQTFESHGVAVLRPRPFQPEEQRYLEHLQPGTSLLYPADPIYVLGRHVIETSIRRPFRRKEVWATRDVLQPLIDRDPQVSHVSIPRSWPGPAGDEGPGPFLE